MSRTRRVTSYAVLTAVGLGVLALSVPAQAGSKGRRTTAGVLAGVAAYSLVKGQTKTGLLAGAGAAYAYKRSKDAEKGERRAAWRRRHSAQVRAYRSRGRHVAHGHHKRSHRRACR